MRVCSNLMGDDLDHVPKKLRFLFEVPAVPVWRAIATAVLFTAALLAAAWLFSHMRASAAPAPVAPPVMPAPELFIYGHHMCSATTGSSVFTIFTLTSKSFGFIF